MVAASHSPPQALRGIRVLDFSHVIAGPFATFHLAQLGAEVTKIEKPGGGDVMRRTASGARAFTALNAGKRMREIDFSTESGRAEVLELARQADVMVDNYRPGVLARHGLGYEDIKTINPRIVYCAISGYGYSDPARTPRPAYDHVIQALTGMTMLAGAEGDPPVKTGFPVIDAATGIIGALAIVTALRERDSTGVGCFLDVSMWASALQLMYPFACETLASGQDMPRVGNKGYSGSPASDTFACQDGWLATGANTPAHVARLMEVLGVAQAEFAPLLEPAPEGAPAFARARDPQAFRELLAARLAGQSAADLERRLNAAGVPAARVRTLSEFTREAADTGLLQPVTLGEGDAQAVTPGLGWRAAPRAWQSAFVPIVPGSGRAPLRVAVRQLGPAAAPAVLCVHGLTRNGHDFDPLAEALAGPFRVLTVDLPGRGDSDWCEEARDYGDALYLEALEAVAQEFKTGPLYYVGTSLGAALGMRLAQRRPELLRALVLNDAGAYADGMVLAELRMRAQQRPAFADMVSARAYLRERYAEFGVETEADWSALEQHAVRREADGMLRQRFDPRVVSDALLPPVVDLWPLWQAVRCPVLILRGQHSGILTRDTCVRMVQGRGDARWIEIPGAGHAPHLAGPARLDPIATFIHEAGRTPTLKRSAS